MKKNSVRSAGKLHLPRDDNDPFPLCGVVGWEKPGWSPLDANCEACERQKEYNDWQNSIHKKKKEK